MEQGAGMLTVMGEVIGLLAPFAGIIVGATAVVAIILAVRRGSGV